jgi:mucin-19
MKRIMNLPAALVVAAALWAAACGGGGATINPPPPTGKYSTSSLNGTYAFVTTGEVITSGGGTATPLSRTGSFTANGSGGINAGGAYDIVNATGNSTSVSQPIPITGGSYTVSADGRGTLTLNVNANGAPSTINFAIVLTSASGGLLMDETANSNQASTGSGNFILQNTASFASGASGVSGAYVFDFTGLDAGANPESIVGQFAASGGVITSGFADANDNFGLSNGSILGSFAADATNGPTTGRGTAVIAGQTYAFYIVDATRVRFISIGNGAAPPMLTGDAVSQPSVPSAPSGSFAFLVSGSSANGGLVRVGRFDTCAQCAGGPGPSVSKLLMDVNSGGSETEFGPNSLTNASISYDSATGRGTLSFQSSATTTYSFVFYLSSAGGGVMQEVSAPAGSTAAVVVADGSLVMQTGSPFTSGNITGPYAMNWSGLVSAGNLGTDEEDLLSQVTVSSLQLSGSSDIFQFTGITLTPDIGTSGSINFNGGDGAGDDGKPVSLTVSLSQQASIDMVAYVVNPQLVFFVNTNQTNAAHRIVAGILKAQQ